MGRKKEEWNTADARKVTKVQAKKFLTNKY